MAKKPERKQKLKVFVTPIGFHDAYVAVPSRKAALEVWGADANIFAQGIAEEVTDPKLMEEPLANPGEVIRRVRGSAEEHVKALGKGAKEKKSPSPRSRSARVALLREEGREERPKPKPKPSRAELDAAEEALEKAEKKQRKKLREVDGRIKELERKRRELERRHEAGRDELSEKRDRARSAYERAMREWAR